MRRNRHSCVFASTAVAAISLLQLFGYSLIGVDKRPSENRGLSLFYNFFSVLCSGIHRECEDYELFSAVACVFVVLLLLTGVLIIVMRMYQFANIGLSRYFSLIPVLPLYGSRALFNPVAALTFRSIIFAIVHDSNYASGAWPLGVLALGASFACSLLLYISHVCYPNSPSSACVGWCWPMSIEILIGIPAIIFCECSGHVEPVIQELLAVAIVIAYFLNVYISVTEMREMSDWYAKTKAGTLLACAGNYIVFLIGGDLKVRVAVTMLALLPLIAVGRALPEYYCDLNMKKLSEAIESGNYEPLKCYSETAIACILGQFSSNVYGNEQLFSWVLENYPDSFDVAWCYVKFACFYGLDLTTPVQQLSKTKHKFWLSVFNFAYLDITFFSDEELLEQHCINAKNEYKYNLMLFWTEVLLGRNERLMELVSVIYIKWIKVEALFERMGHGAHNDKQFTSLISLKLQHGDDKGYMISHDHQQQFDTLLFQEKSDRRDVDQDTKRFGPIEVHLRRYSVLLTAIVHCLRFLWFYVMIILVIVLGYKLRQYGTIVEKGISFFHSFSNITQEIGGIHLGMVLTPWVHTGLLGDDVLRYVVGPNRMFYWVSNASTWVIGEGLDHLEEEIIPFTEDLLTVSMKGLVSQSTNGNSFRIGEFGNLSVLVRLFLVKTRRILEKRPQHRDGDFSPEIEDFMNFSHHTFKVMNGFVNSTLEETYDQIVLATNKFQWSMGVVNVILTLVIVLASLINCRAMKKYFNELMKPLFFIPNADISELRNRLGNTPIAAWKSPEIPAHVKYNMHELAEMPRHSMSTDQRLLYRWILFNVVISFTCSFIIFNITAVLRGYYHEHAEGYKAFGYAVVFQNRLLQLSCLSIDLAYRSWYGFPKNPNLLDDMDRILGDASWHMSNMQSEIAKLSPIIDASIFDARTNRLTNDSFSAYPYYSRCSYLLGHLSVFYNYIRFTNESLTLEDLSILFTTTLVTLGDAIPELREAIFERYNLHALGVATKVRIIWTVLISFMVLAVLGVYIWIPFNGSLVNPVFQTIPSRCVHEFNQYLDLQDTSALQLASEIADEMLNSESTFSLLDDLVLLVNKSNVVVKASTRFSSFLEIDQTIEGQEITEIFSQLTDEHVDIALPPVEDSKFRFHTRLRSTTVELQAQFSPINDAMFGEDVIAYMVIFTDITKLEAMKLDLQNEINHVRMLVSQLVPEIAVKAVLENERFAPMMVQKMIATYVCFTEMKDLTTPWPFKELQKIVQETLACSKKLTFRGKSIQQFFVLSGLSENSLPLMDQAIESIKFSMELIRRVKEYQAKTNTQFNIGIGVHAIGPCFAELTSSIPPIFEVSAPNMVIPTLVANYCSQNQVNITRDVYILVIALGYSILFENEIQDFTGETLSVHYVQSM